VDLEDQHQDQQIDADVFPPSHAYRCCSYLFNDMEPGISGRNILGQDLILLLSHVVRRKEDGDESPA
jgi:hypothetical protein